MTDAEAVFDAISTHASRRLSLINQLAGEGAVEATGEGALVTLSDGREMIDFGSYAVPLLGHRHPIVVRAVEEQLRQMPISTRSLANPAAAELASRLGGMLSGDLQRIWFGLNGSDVVDLAVRLARHQTGRGRILAVEGAFHGKTAAALPLTWSADSDDLDPLVTHVARDDPESVARECAAGDVAALIVEPIQGESGVQPIAVSTLERWRETTREHEALFISDEIQVGFHRCGHLAYAEALGITPDVLLLGKALGGGVLPLSALASGDRTFAPLLKDPFWHSATFAGNPLSCSAGIGALDAIDTIGDRPKMVSQALEVHLRGLGDDFPSLVSEVRGDGLLWGVEFASVEAAGFMLLNLTRLGMLVSPCMSNPSCLRLSPPAITSDELLDRAKELLVAALNATLSELT
ncbi:MAG: aminotransferase class III-fold pyridoxal phosphate-dependent enzyme [Solirubrobacterales bacterium]